MKRGSASRRWISLLAVLVCSWSSILAQTTAQETGSAQSLALPTLHVYTDLVQVPTLVVERDGSRLKQPIAESRFSMSISNGPRFHATHVHIEGDEPISLSILLDVSGDSNQLMANADEAIAGLTPDLLQASDRVSIYSLDCSLVRSVRDVPADRESLRRGVTAALSPWTARIKADKESQCSPTPSLKDALMSVIDTMRDLPGRRVIVAMTSGEDRSSDISWKDLTLYAQQYAVAIFGVKHVEPAMRSSGPAVGGSNPTGGACDGIGNGTAACAKVALYRSSVEDPFNSFCQLSGGSMFLISKQYLWESLMWVTTMLRERYILEYPRPSNGTAGWHGLDVRVDKADYTILPSGNSFPLQNTAVLSDPTTIITDSAQKPQQGRQRVMSIP